VLGTPTTTGTPQSPKRSLDLVPHDGTPPSLHRVSTGRIPRSPCLGLGPVPTGLVLVVELVLAGLTTTPPPKPRPHCLDPIQDDAPFCVLRLLRAPCRMAVTKLTAHLSSWPHWPSPAAALADDAGVAWGNKPWWRTLIRKRSLTPGQPSLPRSGADTGAFCFLDFRHRICYGARGQDGFRDATREEERRRAPHRGEVVPIGSLCEQRRTCWGSERLHFAPGPQPFFTGRARRSRAVPSGQPRSPLRHRRAGRPRRTSKNASRECA